MGDVVKLKSGGPAMTIQHFTGDGDACCQWFDAKGDVKFSAFPQASLAVDTPSKFIADMG